MRHGRFAENENLLFMQGIEPRLLGLVHSLVTVPTALSVQYQVLNSVWGHILISLFVIPDVVLFQLKAEHLYSCLSLLRYGSNSNAEWQLPLLSLKKQALPVINIADGFLPHLHCAFRSLCHVTFSLGIIPQSVQKVIV